MANHAIFNPGATMAKQIDSLNKVGVSATDLDNGNVVVLGALGTGRQDSEVYTCTAPATATLLTDIFYLVYEPEVVTLTTASGKQFRGIDNDVRDFYIPAGTNFTTFKPMIGDVVALSVDGIAGTKGTNTYVAPANGTNQLTWTADATTASLGLKLIGNYNFSVGNTRVTGYKFTVVKA